MYKAFEPKTDYEINLIKAIDKYIFPDSKDLEDYYLCIVILVNDKDFYIYTRNEHRSYINLTSSVISSW